MRASLVPGSTARATVLLVIAILLSSCSHRTEERSDTPPVVKADKPFSRAGSIEMRLEAGDYTIRAAQDERIRVSFAGNIGNATADVTASGSRASLVVRDTPNGNFRATVEVPGTVDLIVHFTAGNIRIAGITGSKEVDSKAGNVEISIPNPNDYGHVDASVTVGDLEAGPFGSSASGVAGQLKWSGPGKYTLRATLVAGNLQLKP